MLWLDGMGTRKCVNCNKSLPKSSFEVSDARGTYLRTVCKSCRNVERNKNRSNNPESYIRHLYSQLKYSRKKKNPELKWAIEPEDLISLWNLQDGRCALTGIFMTWGKDGSGRKELNISIDRIDPNEHYIPGNIQLVCGRVNYMKHTLPEEELYWWCKNIVTKKEDF